MSIDQNKASPSPGYIVLVALLISIGAMATDLMLPALDVIANDLDAEPANDAHFVVTIFFLGMAAGQLLVGPLSDSFGRKPVIYYGYGIFVAGCVICLTTDTWLWMMLGRLLQGFGAAAPRIVTVAMVRDDYEGRAMARVMSIIMAVFIIVPIIAPAIGQALIAFSGWRSTFAALGLLAVSISLWFGLRQRETLAVTNRRPLRFDVIWRGIAEIIQSRVALGYTIATGLMYGIFVGYLGSAQQIFAIVFDERERFVLYFALASASFGAASLLNASLVMRLGMRVLTLAALIGLTIFSVAYWLVLYWHTETGSVLWFLVWQLPTFFCVGIIFGNLNALALEPLGHMAGLGAAFVGSIATFISLPIAALIGHQFDGTAMPLVTGFMVLGAISCLVMYWSNRGRQIV